MAAINITTANAIAELKSLITEVEALKKSTSTVNAASAASFAALESGLKKLQDNAQLTANKFNYLEAILKKQNATNDDLNASINRLNQQISATGSTASATSSKVTRANSKIAGSYKILEAAVASAKKYAQEMTLVHGANSDQAKKATAQYKELNTKIKDVNKSLEDQKKKSTSLFSDLLGSTGKLLSAFGIIAGMQMFANILKGAFETVKTFDSLGFALQKITKDSFDAATSQRFLIEISRDFGVELVATTERWIKFLAAAKQSGLTLKDTEDIFKSLTKAGAVLGLQTDELSSIYLALEQMLSKGKVTTEELRRQLGERLPGAMGIMAASMGVTIAELDKMMKKGEVLSAEVLPNFAKAVEIAFGIESVEKIETLTASQNKLTNAWQLFIKNIAEGSTIIQSVFNGMSYAMEKITILFATEKQKLQIEIIESKKKFEKEMFNISKDAYDKNLALGQKYDDIAKNIKDKQAEITKNKDSKNASLNKERLEQELADLTKIKLDYNKDIVAMEKLDADNKIEKVKKEYDKYIALFNLYADIKDKGVHTKENADGTFTMILEKDVADLEDNLEFYKSYAIKYSAQLEVLRKLREEGNPVSSSGAEDPDKKKKQMIDLKEILDLSDEIKKKIIKNSIELNKRLLESDESTFEDRKNLLLRNQELQKQVADLDFNIDTAKNKKAYDEAIAYLDKHLKDKTLLQVDYDSQTTKLQTEFDQKKELADLKRSKTNNKNAEEAGKGMIALLKEFNDEKIDLVEQPFNKEITALKKTYVESKKTKKDQEDLEWGLADVAMRATNAKIDALIVYAKAERDVVNQSVENIAKWQAEIDKLEASKLVPKPPKDAAEALREFWLDILDMAAQANEAIGNLVDEAFNRKIENINAEIDAEEKKYDKLMQMAGDDAAMKESLQVEHDDMMAKLERKRLKEEQKQAKMRKAFALTDIAISTAQAIIGIWAQVPKFDFGISAGALTAFVSGLAAIQMATVLAQPIPQYKDGIDNVKKAHVGMVNDGKDQEYITRGNKILTTKTRNALIQLQPGDTVHKSFDALSKSSNLMSLAYNGADISKSEFDLLFYGIESSIAKGFKTAKINNNIRLNTGNSNDSYKRSLSKWS